jgi:Flp pilus assembly protein TadG
MTLDRFGITRRGRDERGAALVEFALILPLVMALILGLVSGGAAYNRKISMNGAVREGSRFAATLDGSGSFVTGTWAGDVQARTAELSTGDLTTAQVCVKLVDAATGATVTGGGYSAGTCSGEPAKPPTATSGCVIKVWAARPDKLQVMFFSADLTLTAKSVARYEGTTTGC